MKAIKSDSDSDSDEQKKVARFFRKKKRGLTPSVAAPGVTHPSDAIGLFVCFIYLFIYYGYCCCCCCCCWTYYCHYYY